MAARPTGPIGRMKMTVTEPFPALPSPLLAVQGGGMGRMSARYRALMAQGAAPTRDWRWYTWRTVSAAWQGESGTLLVATELEPEHDDWLAAVALISRAGWMTDFDSPHFEDIGDPVRDVQHEVWLWTLKR